LAKGVSLKVKDIPNEDYLFRWVPLKLIKEIRGYKPNEVPINAFRDEKGKGMSASWDRYSTAKKVRRLSRYPKQTGVVNMNVGKIRKIIVINGKSKKPLNVKHKPTMINYGHSLVLGIPKKRHEKIRIRSKLKDISK